MCKKFLDSNFNWEVIDKISFFFHEILHTQKRKINVILKV